MASTSLHDDSQSLYIDEVLAVEPHGIEHITARERHGKPYLQGHLVRRPDQLRDGPDRLAGDRLRPRVLDRGPHLPGGKHCRGPDELRGRRHGPEAGHAADADVAGGVRIPRQLPPGVLASLLFVGYFTTTNIVGAETIQQIWKGAPYTPMAIILGLIAIVLTIVGYNLVHSVERYMSVILGAHLRRPDHRCVRPRSRTEPHDDRPRQDVLGVRGAGVHGHLLVHRQLGAVRLGLLAVPAGGHAEPQAVRLVVRGHAGRHTWMNILGVYLGTLADKGGILPSIRTTTHGFADVVYLAIIVGGLMVCVINAYSAALSGITWDIPLKRVPAVVLIGVIGIILSVSFGGPKFEPSLEKFLYLVAYFVTPWLAIVIIDFWVLNRGGKDYPPVGEFYKRDGVFGGIRWPGLLAFLIGVGVSVPFMATVLYTGPIGKSFGGADISYGVSAVVASVIFYVMRKSAGPRRSAAVPRLRRHRSGRLAGSSDRDSPPSGASPGSREGDPHPCAGVPTASSITDGVPAATAWRTASPTSATSRPALPRPRSPWRSRAGRRRAGRCRARRSRRRPSYWCHASPPRTCGG